MKTCYSQEELDEWEKYFIFLYNTLYPFGYNLTEGGDGGVPCEETRRKISEANKGKPNLKLSKQILQFTLDGEFVKEWQSSMECERNGFDRGIIRLCCQGKYKQAYGFIWKYKD